MNEKIEKILKFYKKKKISSLTNYELSHFLYILSNPKEIKHEYFKDITEDNLKILFDINNRGSLYLTLNFEIYQYSEPILEFLLKTKQNKETGYLSLKISANQKISKEFILKNYSLLRMTFLAKNYKIKEYFKDMSFLKKILDKDPNNFDYLIINHNFDHNQILPLINLIKNSSIKEYDKNILIYSIITKQKNIPKKILNEKYLNKKEIINFLYYNPYAPEIVDEDFIFKYINDIKEPDIILSKFQINNLKKFLEKKEKELIKEAFSGKYLVHQSKLTFDLVKKYSDLISWKEFFNSKNEKLQIEVFSNLTEIGNSFKNNENKENFIYFSIVKLFFNDFFRKKLIENDVKIDMSFYLNKTNFDIFSNTIKEKMKNYFLTKKEKNNIFSFFVKYTNELNDLYMLFKTFFDNTDFEKVVLEPESKKNIKKIIDNKDNVKEFLKKIFYNYREKGIPSNYAKKLLLNDYVNLIKYMGKISGIKRLTNKLKKYLKISEKQLKDIKSI